MEFRILGPVEVVDGGRAVELGRPKQRALLGLLLLRAGQAVSADRLTEELWHGRPPAHALASLQAYVSNLRRILEPGRRPGEPPQLLVRRPAGYVAQVEPAALDAARFETGVSRARRAAAAGDAAVAERLFDEALALWRGPPLGELADEIEPIPELPRLSELRLAALEERYDAALALGRDTELVADLDALVREHPLRERLRGQLALALYRVGRQADALERLREGRRVLSDELGLSPSPALRDLEQQILQHAPELAWTPPPEPAAPGGAAAIRPERALVGRADELAALAASWAEATEGRGAVALISGEPGIGKTRLAEEVAALAAEGGGLPLWGHAFEGGGAPAFWPWTQVLEDAAAGLDDDALRVALGARAPEVVRIAPELGERLGVDEQPMGDAAEARSRLYDAVARFLTRLAAERPLTVLLDDVHWADAPSLELVRWLAGRIRRAPVLLVATYRDNESDRSPALTELLAGLVREAPLVRVELGGLAVEDVSLLVAQQLAARPPAQLARRLHSRTDGNAFYLSELVRLVQGPGLDRGEGAVPSWDEVPSSVREVIERRVAALPEPTVAALETAAVIGRDFDLETTAAAHEVASEALLELLDPALAARIVGAAPGSPYDFRFAHALVRETVYARLPISRRARLHAAAAAALEGRAPAGRLSELAFHYERAAPLGLADRAADAALAAAAEAEQMLAFEQAEQHLRQALRVLEGAGDPGRRELGVQVRLTSLLLMTSGYTDTGLAEAAARVRMLATQEGSDPALPGVLWALSNYHRVRADFEAALEVADELLEHGRTLGERVSSVAGSQVRGAVLWHRGRLAEGCALLEAAIDELGAITPEELDRAGLASMAIQTRCLAAGPLALLDRAEEAEVHLQAALNEARPETHPFDYAVTALHRGWLSALRGELRDALEWLQEAARVCEDYGFRQLTAIVGAMLGWTQARGGHPEEGIATVEAAIESMTAAEGRLVRSFHLCLLGEALLAAGREDDALAAVERGIGAAEEFGTAYYLPELLRLEGELLARRGREADGLARLEHAIAVAAEQGSALFRRRAESSLESLRGKSGGSGAVDARQRRRAQSDRV